MLMRLWISIPKTLNIIKMLLPKCKPLFLYPIKSWLNGIINQINNAPRMNMIDIPMMKYLIDLIISLMVSFSFIASKFCGKDRERNYTNKSNRRFFFGGLALVYIYVLATDPFLRWLLHLRSKQISDSLNAIILAS